MQRWMMRIGFEEIETFACDLLNLYRELSEQAPELVTGSMGSKLFRLAASVFGERVVGKLIESAIGHILLELPIPSLPVVFDEPGTERSQLLRLE
ncbi:MAG: hypothetical protein ABR524_05025, partial [Thermoanaerobaculia bacterium]